MGVIKISPGDRISAQLFFLESSFLAHDIIVISSTGNNWATDDKGRGQ